MYTEISFSSKAVPKGDKCKGCKKGNRMYVECIKIKGEYGGCCGNCKRRDRGANCTARDLEKTLKDDKDQELKIVDYTILECS